MESTPVGRNFHPDSYKPSIMSHKKELFLSQFQFYEEKLVASKHMFKLCFRASKHTHQQRDLVLCPQFQVQIPPHCSCQFSST